MQLVECVPNLSEGSRQDVIAMFAQAVTETRGVVLLDRTSDADHDRSVLTFAGPPDAVLAAMRALAIEAVARIDMRTQHGRHPRIGALDVVPFVPLGDTPMDTCIGLARDFGAWLAARFEVPVFLYARAATRPDRQVLADIRRPGFEGLAAALAATDGAPDFGPARPHPTAGATVVGARPFLVAWNIELETRDIALARRIATAIRERDGGCRAVQALGVPLESAGCVQVSMNLLDHERTPMWRVLERVRALASDADVEVRDSELIGLAPVRAFLDTADHIGVDRSLALEARVLEAARWLAIRDASPGMALELPTRGRYARLGADALLQDDHGRLLRDGRDGDVEPRHRLRVGDAHLLEESLQRGRALVLVADRHGDDQVRIEAGCELRGTRRGEGPAHGDAGDLDVADVAQHLLGQHVSNIAEVDGVESVHLEHERGVAAPFRALGLVAEGADPRDQHLVDLVLARRIDGERALEAGGADDAQHGRAECPRRPVVAGSHTRPVRVTVGADVSGQATSGRSGDRSIGVRHDHALTTLEADAGISEPGDLHGPDGATCSGTAGDGARAEHPGHGTRGACPIGAPRSEGGRGNRECVSVPLQQGIDAGVKAPAARR